MTIQKLHYVSILLYCMAIGYSGSPFLGLSTINPKVLNFFRFVLLSIMPLSEPTGNSFVWSPRHLYYKCVICLKKDFLGVPEQPLFIALCKKNFLNAFFRLPVEKQVELIPSVLSSIEAKPTMHQVSTNNALQVTNNRSVHGVI